MSEYSPSRLPRAVASLANVALGIATIITPFMAKGVESHGLLVSDVITGIVVLLVGLISYGASRHINGTGISGINILAGIWLIISVGFATTELLKWDNVMLGVLCIVNALATMGEHDHYLKCVGVRR